jgi:hypothetical protein
VDAADAARRWASEWARAWREHDAARVRALYAEGADFRSSPFREPQPPGDYADWAFESEAPDPDVRFGEPLVVGDDRALVEYWATVRDEAGRETTIAGVSLLRFDGAGMVSEQRDYWNESEGPRDPHRRWGS